MKILNALPSMLLTAVILCTAMPVYADTAAFLTVKGQGMIPSQNVTLTTGPKQSITSKVSANGEVAFNNLRYKPSDKLSFALSYSVKGGGKTVPNNIVIDLDPYVGMVSIEGNATRAASIVLSVSSEDSSAIIANQSGYFAGSADTMKGFYQGDFRVVASLINVDDTCCPRSFKPYNPVTISISAQPEVLPKKAEAPIIETIQTATAEMTTADIAYGVSVPSEFMTETYVQETRNIADATVQALINASKMMGTFFNGQANLDAHRALQQAQAKAARKYLPSEALCRYGSLSLGLSASEAIANTNKNIMANMLIDKDSGIENTQASLQGKLEAQMKSFTGSNCDYTDSNTALAKACRNNRNDTRFNGDLDYTRNIDAPMTIPVDFSNSTAEPQEQDILALTENLFPTKNLNKQPKENDYVRNSQSFYSLQAFRSLARNSFLSLVSEKAQGTSNSASFINALMTALGVPAASARAMMGDNPSYYAQMEVMTKKIYQDPAFYVNLMETPANVARQQAAIRAIKLQQQNDFAKVVKRREMLLAALLELKIREKSKMVNQRLTPAKASQ